MVIIEEYKENPCGVLSIPYWKNKRIRIPENMCVVHDTKYVEENYRDYHDEPYFRLYHDLVGVKPFTLDGLSIVTAKYDDIPLLVDFFVDQVCSETGMHPREIDADALQMLVDKSWTGNIRELRNVVERLLILSGDRITASDVSAYVIA